MKNSLIIIIVSILFSCKSSADLTQVSRSKVRTEVESLLQKNFRLIEEYGYTAELQSLDNSPEFFWVPPGKSMPISYDSVASILKKFTPGYRSVKNVWDTLYVQVIRKDLATYTGRFHATYTDTTGRVSHYNMMEIGIAIKRKNGWKLLCGQTSAIR